MELATIIRAAGADVNKANNKGDTALLSAVAANRLALAQLVVSWGGDVEAVRQGGVGFVALALISQVEDMIKFVMEHGPPRITMHAEFNSSAVAQAYLSLTNMRKWLLARVAPCTLALEVGALMTLPGVEAGTRKRLDEVRAFLHQHEKVLEDPSVRRTPHCVEQLVSQWPGAVFQADASAGSAEPSDEMRLVECCSPEQLNTGLRFSLSGSTAILCVAFSPDGSKLARAEGNDVTVCCAVSYIELYRLVGHR